MEISTPKRFACHVGLLSCDAGQSGIWIESPRTGKRVVFWRPWFSNLPARVPGKIAQAASRGLHHVEFTVEELKQIAQMSGSCPATPPSTHSHIRYWGRRRDSRKRIGRMYSAAAR